MKQNDSKNPKKKNFLRIPSYPGGKEAYRKFIFENLVYPEEALSKKVEGLVYVEYTVNNIGEIVDVEVKKGIGSGCDEEAIRLVRMLTYEPARNRGIKMKALMKTRIHFKLTGNTQTLVQPGIQVNYTSTNPVKAEIPEQKPKVVYNYTLNLGK